MEQTSNKKWIKVVCIVLACLLVVGLAIGAFVFFNGNYYRFRMSAFEGVYISNRLIENSDLVMKFTQTEVGTDESDHALSGYCTSHSGQVRIFSFQGDETIQLSEDNFDTNVLQILEDYSAMFEKKCVIERDAIYFLSYERKMSITYTKYYATKNAPTQKFPIRIMSVIDEQTGYQFELELTTGYLHQDDPTRVWGGPQSFSMSSTNINVVGSDNKNYSLLLNTNYISPKIFEMM